jgi:hypothetical protein
VLQVQLKYSPDEMTKQRKKIAEDYKPEDSEDSEDD